jgi:hypothetical protein
MTSLHLLLWIVSGIVLQVAIYLGIGFWRHWQEYQALRSRAVEFNLPVKAPVPTATSELATASWPGFRTFRVERKVTRISRSRFALFTSCRKMGKVLPPFLPGQFLTFRLDLPTTTGVPNRSPAAIRCPMRLAPTATASRSNGYCRQRAANFQQGAPPVSSTTRWLSAASSRCVRPLDIFISIVATHR